MSITLQKDFDLNELAEQEPKKVAVSLYLALDHQGENPGANQIRLKNLLTQTRALLEERVDDSRAINSLLKSLEKIDEHDVFAETKYAGLGLLGELGSPDQVSVFPLRSKPETRASIGKNYFLTPLIEEQMRESVLLVCLADNSLRLFEADSNGLNAVEIPEGCPESVEEAKRFELSAGLDGNELYKNTTASPGAGDRHGQGISNHVLREFHQRYCRKIGESLKEHFGLDHPILLAGVKDRLVGFREVNPELNFLQHDLEGNYEKSNQDEIEAAATQILSEGVQDRVLALLQDVLQQAENLREEDPKRLEEAASASRIETLFLRNNGSKPEEYDSLALQVLRHGGTVYVADLQSWEGPILAKLRW